MYFNPSIEIQLHVLAYTFSIRMGTFWVIGLFEHDDIRNNGALSPSIEHANVIVTALTIASHK